ncbi:4-(cytidine 5'-diphospho)-2-C-methyl-D-erythritol kinase [Yoonia sp. R2331]|uniref:4-(cytidine 5'-diphospho)-2-C-methyl-D-erythritol kinase n=1 Tax=Yoonia sp. R2331 TaxID=3237238 RepID=UPI0034E5E310
MILRAPAPAKVNLTLHVTGQRDDGYHLLDSLVVFADVADQIAVTAAPDLRITVSGPFSDGVPTDHTNLVIRAAELLRNACGIGEGAAITLEKHLPNAAGIGGGSSDAATALGLLAKLWNVAPLPPNASKVLALGADLPVCMAGPTAQHMTGIGETLTPVPDLPDCAVVLVNPRVKVPTQGIFRGLSSRSNPAMTPIPRAGDFDGFAHWLEQQRNDLLPPARALTPEIDATLAKLTAMPKVRIAGMSGSGATCFGLVRNMADARHVARAIQVSEMGWWVAPALVL